MPSSSLDTLLPLFARRFGAFVGSFTTTANPDGAAKTLTSTELEDAGHNADSDLDDHWVRITSGTDDDNIRRVDSHTGSGGVLTLASGASISSGSSITFEVYTRDPQELIDYLNAGRTGSFPALHRIIHDRDTSGISGQTRYGIPSPILTPQRLYEEPRLLASLADNLLGTLDSGFEGDLTDFTATDATLTAEAEVAGPDNKMVWSGGQSGKIVVTAGNTGYVYLVVPSPTNFVGEELNLSLWLHALTVASVTVKAAMRTDAGSWAVGSAHGGTDWERLSVALSDQSIATSIHMGVEIVNGSADDYVVHTDEWLGTAGRTENPFSVQWEPITNWRREGDFLVIPDGVSADKQLLISGIAALSSVAAGSDTMEIGEDHYESLFQAAIAAATEAEFQDLDQSELNTMQRLNTHARNRRDEAPMVLPSTRRTPL